MFYAGARAGGGDLDEAAKGKVGKLFVEFGAAVAREVDRNSLRRGVVRTMLPCSLIVVLDQEHLFVAAQKQLGMPTTLELDQRSQRFTATEIEDSARWEFGFDEPFIIQFPVEMLEQDASSREGAIAAIAQAHVQAEIQRVHREMNVIQINPIFGPTGLVYA